MTPLAAATEILRLQAEVNPGMGVRCARDTATYLSRGDCDTARVRYLTDKDKLYQYPDLLTFMETYFGE